MFPNGRNSFTCAVKKRARERARYRARMETPEGREKIRAKSYAQFERRKDDPAYRVYRQLWELTRVRVRY